MIRNEAILENVNNILDYDNVKDFLFMRVINLNTNKELLENVPHTIVGDLAITYHVMIQTTSEKFCSAKITNQLLNKYGINVIKLHKDAEISSPKMMIPEVVPIETLLLGVPEEIAYLDKNKQLIIVTNEHKTDGAASMFYPNILNDIAHKLDNDLYIIPSSIDEVLILSDSSELNYQHVKNTLDYVNKTIVDDEHKLSNELYHYSKDEHLLEKVDDYEKRIHKNKYSQLLH